MTDERANPGVVVPPPLIYLGPLVLGLLLNAGETRSHTSHTAG